MIVSAAPINSRATRRQSADSVWPLRDEQGRTWAERKEQEKSRDQRN